MASGQRSSWPIVLFLGLCVSLLLGSAAAVAAPSDDDGIWWHDGDPQRVTGHVVEVDREAGSIVLDELVGYDDERIQVPTAGAMRVIVTDLGDVRPDETVDVEVVRHDGTWAAAGLTLLDTD
jgi:hypothetical protein